MLAHVVENGKVVNTIEVVSLSDFPNLIPALEGGIGWTVVGQEVYPPVPEPVVTPVPERIAMWQARDFLIANGLMSTVKATIAAIVDPVKRERAESKFEFSNTVERSDPLLNYVCTQAGFTKEQVDGWFINAGEA